MLITPDEGFSQKFEMATIKIILNLILCPLTAYFEGANDRDPD